MNAERKPLFWRDCRLPHVELRKVSDGRQVCYAPHSHTQWSVGAITGGESTFQYRNDHYQVRAGDLVLMNPEWVHACNPIDDMPWAYLMLYVDTGWLTDLRFRAGLLQEAQWKDFSTATISDPLWYERYCRMADCLLDPQRDLLEKQTEVAEFLSDLMHELSRQPGVEEPNAPEALTMLAAYLDDYAAEDTSLDTLCEISGYSAGHLIRAFRQYFGFTPHAYQVNRRVQLGRHELKNGTPIAAAAFNAGFADQPHFHRTFKRLMAVTPNQYRRSSPDQEI
ncbi:AraC family transcriptional regulator [Halomonas sp. McH1-25]|uniref:AraC family transcriptional regulator n=1 Tax=unclassified Halomonas TaxID=2609666 RepID=UPI001EF5EF1F|nr:MULTISPECIES: AraC family transcriptional regulator [unclassified Halomonas]MCG7600233.1 AraC family transcriptional regulator [Halomonas sp. McH1-25]MCP1343106.1 AraC family transcriptional regulator [Halomonas sp. FL8]MCP1360485.1 AraC family transcriptional regulator [Halomonas sp. BBD45]MCP1366412.1 AraC family transcriptional regulator [Halomonas sp. BBD48]